MMGNWFTHWGVPLNEGLEKWIKYDLKVIEKLTYKDFTLTKSPLKIE